MKVKRFENIWTMGLILCGCLLVVFYIAKLFFPQWIIGVAEIPSVVKIGKYIDKYAILNHLANFIYGLIICYFYCCACSRTYKLNQYSWSIVVSGGIILRLVSILINSYYAPINYVFLVLFPFLVCIAEKNLNKKTFISTVVCFSVDIFSQIFSIKIRNIVVMAHEINFATYTILLIDMLIWRVLLYLYFNYKNKKGD